MSAEHLIWRTDPGRKYCVLGGLLSVPPKTRWALERGVTGGAGFPADAHFKVSKDSPKKVVLSDALDNFPSMVLVSTALKDFIMARSPKLVETLPVRVLNRDGKDLGADFWILNPVEIVDCIDLRPSEVVWNALDPTQISGFKKLVLTPDIPRDLLLLRPRYLEQRVLVRRELVDAIMAEGFTGLRFAELDGFSG